MKRKKHRAQRQPFVRAIYNRNRLRTALAALLVLMSAAVSVGMTYFLRTLLDIAAAGDFVKLKQSAALMLGVVLLVDAPISFACFRLRNRAVEISMRQYKAFAFDRVLNKNIRSFTDESASRYVSALTNDALSVQDNYVKSLFEIISNAAQFAFGLTMMLAYSWSLTLLSVAFTLLPMLLSMALSGRLTSSEQALSARNERFVASIRDLLSGFSVVKSFKAERSILGLFRAENEATERTRRHRADVGDLIGFIPMEVGGLAQLSIFAFGALWTIRGWITIGVVLAFVQLMNYLIGPVQRLPGLLASRRAAGSLIDKLAEAVAENADCEGAIRLDSLSEGICLEDVGLTYSGAETPALADVSLRFEAGKSYVVVGASGSGKTTLLNLLLGSWEDYSGSVRLDGVELRNVATESLYDLVSVIQQNVFVFDSTIEQNICMFGDFPAEEVARAVRGAGLENLIRDKGGDYRCGENGSGLSGGEKQRVSIARALLRRTPVLLLDEATSALDRQTAFEVTDAILSSEGVMRIVVTHRLEESLLCCCDQIVVLRGGRVAETGTFAELMAKKGYFFSLYNVTA